MRAIIAACVLALVGCKSTPENGFAVDVTVTADASLAGVAAQIATLDVSVSGAEMFHTTYPISGQLANGGAKFIYRPAASSGALDFAIYALDDDGNALGYGTASATLKSGATVTLTVTLGAGNVPSTDMSMCPPPCSPLGTTQCSGTQVQTCQLIDGCLTWAPAADCGADMLCCGSACVAADVSNCYACGTACSGSTPACLTTPKKCGCTIAVCAPPAAWAATARLETAWPALPCPPTAPISTSTPPASPAARATQSVRSTRSAPPSPRPTRRPPRTRTIHIAAGMYATGETFPLVVRKGISLVGAGATTTTIKGTGLLDHSAAGGALNGTTYNVTILTGDQTGTSTISGLTVTNTLSAATAGYLGVFCDQGNAANTQTTPPPATLPTPTTVLSGVTIGSFYDYGVIAATTTTPAALLGCNIKITGSTINGNNNGMWIVGCGAGVGKISCAGQLGDGTAAGGNTFSNNKNAGGGIAVLGYDCVSPLTFDNNTFDGDDNGIVCTNHSGAAGGDGTLPQPDVYEVRNNTFKNIIGTGLEADRGGGHRPARRQQLHQHLERCHWRHAWAAALRFTTTNSW